MPTSLTNRLRIPPTDSIDLPVHTKTPAASPIHCPTVGTPLQTTLQPRTPSSTGDFRDRPATSSNSAAYQSNTRHPLAHPGGFSTRPTMYVPAVRAVPAVEMRPTWAICPNRQPGSRGSSQANRANAGIHRERAEVKEAVRNGWTRIWE